MYICIYNFPNSQILLIEFNWGFLERILVSAVVAPTGLTPDLAWKKKNILCKSVLVSIYISKLSVRQQQQTHEKANTAKNDMNEWMT